MTMFYSQMDHAFMAAQLERWRAEDAEKEASARKIREKADLSKHGIGPHLAAKLD